MGGVGAIRDARVPEGRVPGWQARSGHSHSSCGFEPSLRGMALVAAAPSGVPAGGGVARATVNFAGVVFVDRDDALQRWVLSHAISGERVELTAPFNEDCVVVFDEEEGAEAVVASGNEEWEPLVVGDILQTNVWCQGGAYSLSRTGGDGREVELGLLEALNCVYEIGSVTCPFGPLPRIST